MIDLFAKTLLLATGFLLALPPGWCCSIPFALESLLAGEGPAPAAPECHCCSITQAPTCPDHPQGEAPQPITPDTCCCGHRDLLPSASVDHDIDQGLGIVTTLPAGLLSVHAIRAFNAEPRYLPIPLTPIHVLDCVWLC